MKKDISLILLLVFYTLKCADGEAAYKPVSAGSRQHYSNCNNATNDSKYKKDHKADACIGK